jgi:hypothetical protein
MHHLYCPSSLRLNQKKDMETNSLLKKVNWLLAASIVLLVLTLAVGSSLFVSCESAKSETPLTIDYTKEQLIERGAYLVNTSACHDCHSPKVMTPNGPEPDPERLLSGHPSDLQLPVINKEAMKDWVLFNQHNTASVGPWGASFSANISSDETGIGNWTEEQFFRAIREGKYKGLEGSRSLLPPMPWQVYKNMTDHDIRSIFEYLKSTRPINNVVPAPRSPGNF